jgi:imidazole glycerol-phosphate synthase subunit HisH
MSTCVIIDCGVGNLRSVQKIFERQGVAAQITSSKDDIASAEAIVLPGVGAFGDAMRRLETDGLVDVIRRQVGQNGKPLLGICLGMHLLARGSTESPGVPGLGLVPADVVSLRVADYTDWWDRRLTLPHIGWNDTETMDGARLFTGIEPGTDFYFVHSYHLIPDTEDWIAARTNYGDVFVAGLEKNNIFAAQFHPEKSQKQGQRVIGNFIAAAGIGRGAQQR